MYGGCSWIYHVVKKSYDLHFMSLPDFTDRIWSVPTPLANQEKIVSAGTAVNPIFFFNTVPESSSRLFVWCKRVWLLIKQKLKKKSFFKKWRKCLNSSCFCRNKLALKSKVAERVLQSWWWSPFSCQPFRGSHFDFFTEHRKNGVQLHHTTVIN